MLNLIRSVKNKIDARKNNKLKKQLKSCGANFQIRGKIMFSFPENISIGNNVHIGSHAWFVGKGGIKIGDNAHISRHVTIISANHNYLGVCLPYDNTYRTREVVIGKNVWIGMHVKIVPGITIGDGAIIGMGTVVAKDVPSLAIIGSGEYKIIKYRDSVHYNKLESENKYGGKSGIPLDNNNALSG